MITALVLLSFAVYQLFISKKFVGYLFVRNEQNRNKIVLYKRISGILLLGISAVGIDSLDDFAALKYLGDTSAFSNRIPAVILPALLVLTLNWIYLSRFKKEHEFPQLHYEKWTLRNYFINTGAWLSYLFFYEWLLRGLLLPDLMEYFNVYLAVVINLVIYAILHLFNSKKEAIASIPFGVVLCVLTIVTGSFLAAYIIHVVFALSFEYISLYCKHKSPNQLINYESVFNRGNRVHRQ